MTILIFDKSVLESLNKDEALLLEKYFFSNISPVLFLEVIADLKEVPREIYKNAEHRVASLAEKLPITSTNVSASHNYLVKNELFYSGVRGQPIPMHGVCIPSSIPRMGKTTDGRLSHYYEGSDEEKAMSAWRELNFSKLDQLLAAQWQSTQKSINPNELAENLGKELQLSRMPKFNSVEGVKKYTDGIVNSLDSKKCYHFLKMLLGYFGAEEKRTKEVLYQWKQLCLKAKRIIRPSELFPYTLYVFKVDIFYHLALAQRLVESSKKSKSHIDLQYIYYLPFCMSFTSGDDFHKKVAPLFLRPDQTFIDGQKLKSSLKRISLYLKSLPENEAKIRNKNYPPKYDGCVVCETYDFHNKNWEKQASAPPNIDNTKSAELVKKLKADIDHLEANSQLSRMSGEPEIVTKVYHLNRQQMKDRFGLSDAQIDEILKSQNEKKK